MANGPYEESAKEAQISRATARGMMGRKLQEPSLVERLKLSKTDLEERLQQVNEALEALEKNPEVERILHLVTRVGPGLY
jgi:hypothetical protein